MIYSIDIEHILYYNDKNLHCYSFLNSFEIFKNIAAANTTNNTGLVTPN